MPFVEITHAAQNAASAEQKRALIAEIETIFREVLDTPDGRLRVFFHSLALEDSNAPTQSTDTPSK